MAKRKVQKLYMVACLVVEDNLSALQTVAFNYKIVEETDNPGALIGMSKRIDRTIDFVYGLSYIRLDI